MPPREGFRQESREEGIRAVIDPYLPNSGNFGYRVSRYELDLEYKVAINRLSGSATITAVTLHATAHVHPRPVRCADGDQGVGERHAPAHFGCYGGKLHVGLASALPAGAAMSIVVRYGGSPRPVRSLWGDVGFEELSDGVLVAGQPNGAASWFPCDDHPSAKASYRIRVSTESPYTRDRQRCAGVAAGAGRADDVDVRAARADVDLSGHPADRHVRDGPADRGAGADAGRAARAAAAQLRPTTSAGSRR